MKKFTPGPWKMDHVIGRDFEIRAADGYSVTTIPNDELYGRAAEDIANARLIAAGPEMYDLLERIHGHIAGVSFDNPQILNLAIRRVIGMIDG